MDYLGEMVVSVLNGVIWMVIYLFVLAVYGIVFLWIIVSGFS